jgi:hypothetical protein
MRTSIDTAGQTLGELQAGFSRALLQRSDPSPSGLIHADRFRIHRNTVFAGLVSALRARYPVAGRLVGEEFFDGVASLFIESHPPTSPVLIEYSGGFAAFLESFEPAGGLPYLTDVARLEWLRHAAYHSAEGEPLKPDHLSHVPAGCAGALTFELHPSASLFLSPYPAISIWETNTFDAEVRAIGPDLPGEAALIVRPGAEVTVLRLDRGEHAFASALAASATLENAAAQAAACDDFSLAPALAKLITAGAFCRFTLPQTQAGDLMPCST